MQNQAYLRINKKTTLFLEKNSFQVYYSYPHLKYLAGIYSDWFWFQLSGGQFFDASIIPLVTITKKKNLTQQATCTLLCNAVIQLFFESMVTFFASSQQQNIKILNKPHVSVKFPRWTATIVFGANTTKKAKKFKEPQASLLYFQNTQIVINLFMLTE